MEWIKSLTYDDWIRIALIALYVISVISGFIRSRVKSSKLQALFSVLPDAMEKAEQAGRTPQEKLDIAVEYIQSEVKHLSRNTIVNAIENGVKISKVANIAQEQKSSDSRSTR